MTPEQLQAIGCKVIHWNPKWAGGWYEFYLPVTGNGCGPHDTRLSVRLNNPDYPIMVWLVFPGNAHALKHITTIEQFKTMYTLLTGKKRFRKLSYELPGLSEVSR